MRNKHPKHGDHRVVKKFLFFPMTIPCKDGVYEWRWLETASFEQKYSERFRMWWDLRWID